MAVGFPAKTDFATGDVLTATNVNDITGTLNLLNPSAKGTIFSASAANTPAALAVGANDLLITADSTQSTGLKYSGAWTSFTPTYANFSLGNGTVSTKYCKIGKVVHYRGQITLGSTSTVTGVIQVYLPINSVNSETYSLCQYLEAGVQYIQGTVNQQTTTLLFQVATTSGTYGNLSNTSATVPFTWGTGDQITWFTTYEVA